MKTELLGKPMVNLNLVAFFNGRRTTSVVMTNYLTNYAMRYFKLVKLTMIVKLTDLK